jgi:hypothetical protein
MITVEQIQYAKSLANKEANRFFQEKLGGRDQYSCGFAWVDVHGVRSNSKQGKDLRRVGRGAFSRCGTPARCTCRTLTH